MDDNKREALEAEKAELEKQIEALEKKSTDYGSDVDGGDEESSETEEIGTNLGIIQVQKERLAEIEDELNN